ncbi:MAG: hypothetical protein V3U92_19540 [Cellulophaga sp.]
MTSNEKINEALEDCIDSQFPKGDKARGKALVLLGIAHIEIRKAREGEIKKMDNFIDCFTKLLLQNAKMKKVLAKKEGALGRHYVAIGDSITAEGLKWAVTIIKQEYSAFKNECPNHKCNGILEELEGMEPKPYYRCPKCGWETVMIGKDEPAPKHNLTVYCKNCGYFKKYKTRNTRKCDYPRKIHKWIPYKWIVDGKKEVEK